MTRTEQLFTEIKNLGYNVEMTNAFSYLVDKRRRYLDVFVLDKPDEQLINLVQSCNATIEENILYRLKPDGELYPVKIYDIIMPEPDFV